MIKGKEKRLLTAGILFLMVVACIIKLDPGEFLQRMVEGVYPQRIIEREELFENTWAMSGYEIEGDSLRSVDRTNWLYLEFKQYGIRNAKLLNVNVESISQEGTMKVYYVDSYLELLAEISEGQNRVYLAYNTEGIEGLRLDLASIDGVDITIRDIEINNTADLTHYIQSWILKILAVAVYILAGCLVYSYMKEKGESYIAAIDKKHWLDRKDIDVCIFLLIPIAVFMAAALGIAAAGYILAILLLGSLGYIHRNYENHTGQSRWLHYGIGVIFAIVLAKAITMVESGTRLLTDNSVELTVENIFIAVLTAIIWTEMLGFRSRRMKEMTRLWEKAIFLYAVLETTVRFFSQGMEWGDGLRFIRYHLLDEVFMANIILILCLVTLLWALAGRGLATVLLLLLYSVLLIGNVIKLKYQGTVLKPVDIFVVSDMWAIAGQYVNIYLLFLLFLVCVGAGAVLIIRFRKKVVGYLWPEISKALILVLPLCIFFVSQVNGNCFYDLGINKKIQWMEETDIEQAQGIGYYTYYSLTRLSEVQMEEPQDYGSNIGEILGLEQQPAAQENDMKPNIVLIMAESLFDISKVDGIEVDEAITENIHKYQVADVISPRFGGGTAAVEFEALTGLSNVFFLNDMIAYSSYFKLGETVNSIVSEFNENGYYTVACHPNSGSFYNREVAYADMGFQDFVDVAGFEYTSETILNGNILRDSEFFNEIRKQLEEGEGPQFIFGITMEAHSPYEGRFDTTSVSVESDVLAEDEMEALTNYVQTVSDINDEIGKMVEFIDSFEEPTIFYLWGDHLPALDALEKVGYTEDESNKYTVPMIAFSNYTDVEIGEPVITPNQIATQILKDSGISYHSYFDYIYGLREEYPVIQSYFLSEDDIESDLIQKYYMIEYDIMFGNSYLLE